MIDAAGTLHVPIILMKKFWEKTEKVFGLQSLNREELLFKVMPRFLMEIMHRYFRVQIEGIENLPKTGPVIIAPNHSGYSGFDAMLISWEIYKAIGRRPKVLTHHFWFLTKTTALPAQKMGFIEATMQNGLIELEKKKMIILFPEGEQGNFKASSKAYKLQEFRRGFIRMALRTQAPIVPTVVIGAEETHINLQKLKFTKYLRGTILPLPLNFLPLPAKWKIKFLQPIYLPYKPEAVKDRELVLEITSDVRERLQKAINSELKKRKSVFFD